MPAAALLGAFFSLAFAETVKSGVHVVTLLVSAAVMGVCLFAAKALRSRGCGNGASASPSSSPSSSPTS
ncbi:hypothetical protein [Sinomonas cyclohexanicum]|uniref:hypothetical protein n=1 Tax=Sinomonas cyclohexanicum TaxID=322009 RepID=UPI001E5C6883|nr:hypothetical protein [Corynebacterium cyclohexanicum]